MASNLPQNESGFKFINGADPGVGKDNEKFVIALIMARLFQYSSPNLPKREFDDFDFGFNLKNVGNIDDVVIFLKKNQKASMNIAVQLKHSNRKKLSGAMLCGDKGEFALKKYLNYASSCVHIDYCVLYTNIEFNENTIMKKSERVDESQKNVQEYLIRKHNGLKLLQTNSDSNEIYSFVPVTKSSEQDLEFFNKFFLYAKQKSWWQMEEEVKRILYKQFNADEHAQKIYIELCSWWHNKKNVTDVIPREPKQNRKGIGKMLVVSLLKPFLITVKPPDECQKQWEILIKAAENFDVTVIFSDVCKNWAIPLEDNNFSLWSDQSTVPIIIKTLEAYQSNQAIQAINIMSEIGFYKHIIVLGFLDTEKIKKEVCLFQNLNKLDKSTLEEVLIKFNLPFETLLKLFKKEKDVMLNEVTPSLLFDVTTNKEKNEELKLPECYVLRTLEAPVIYDISIISNIIKDAFIFLIIDNDSNDVKETLEKIGKNIPVVKIKNMSTCYSNSIVLINEEANFYDILSSFRKNHPGNNVYFFKIIEDAKLEWIQSDGPNIQKLNNPKTKIINENLLSTDFHNKINIICAEPGMGKSTTLKLLHNQLLLLNYYPKFISFKEHVAFFRTFNSSESAESILKYFLNIQNIDVSNLAPICALSRGCLWLLFDALDELDSKYLPKAIECVQKLSTLANYNLKIWISTRKHLKDQVENVFKVHAIDLGIIIELDQKEYIKARLIDSSYEENTIENTISQIYQNFTLFEQNSDVLGIPLQLFIITEVLIDNVDTDDDTYIQNLMVLTKLCHEFFKGKMGHALSKSTKKFQHIDKFYNTKKYEIVALKVCLNESDFNSLKIKQYDKSVQDIKNSLTIGIVTNFNDDGVASFEHHTFAEYFCASYFAENVESIVHLKKFIFQPKYHTIRLLLNMKLSEESPLHLAVIYRNLDIIINTDEDEIKSSKDSEGRNLLQTAICCGVNYPAWKPVDANSFETCKDSNYEEAHNDNDNDVIYKEPTTISIDSKLENILKHLCSLCNFEEKDDLFEWSSYEYSTKVNDLSIINIMLDFKQNILLENHCLIKKRTVLGYSAVYGLINLVKILCLKFSINFVNEVKFKKVTYFSYFWQKAIHLATERNQADYIKFLTLNKVDVDSKDSNGWTSLYLAAQEGYLQCLKELVAIGSDINCTNPNGLTALDIAAQKGHLQCLEELIAKNDEVNSNKDSNNVTPSHSSTQKGHLPSLPKSISKNTRVISKYSNVVTILHIAAYGGHLQWLQKLIAKSASEVNSKDPNGHTPLHLAAQQGHLQCLQELIAKGGEVNSKSLKGWTPLHFAAYDGHLQCFQEIIAKGGEVNSKNFDHRTPLYLAAYRGHLKCLEELIGKGGEVNSKDSYGRIPLHIAACNGHLQCLQELIAKNSEVNCKDSNYRTPLHLAAYGGNLQCLQQLIAKNGDVNCKDSDYWTPLHLAAYEGHLQCIKELIANNGKTNSKNSEYQTPLHIAAYRGHLQCLQEIIANGGEVNSKDSNGDTPLHSVASQGYLQCLQELIAKRSDICSRNTNGVTPLHFASQAGHLECLQKLIANGGKINSKESTGRTPLHCAAQGGHLHCLQEIITKGGEVNSKDSSGSTPLHFAVNGGHFQCVKELVIKGADIHSKEKNSFTSLHFAAQKGDLQCLQELITNGGDIHFKAVNGWTPLHVAAQLGQLQCFQELITYGGDVNCKDSNGLTPLNYITQAGFSKHLQTLSKNYKDNSKNSNGRTPLHFAAQEGHLQCLQKLLIAKSHDVNSKNSNGQTPLHFAAQKGHSHCLQELIAKGGAVNFKNSNGRTPLHSAAQGGHSHVVQELIAKGGEVNSKDSDGQTPLHIAAQNGHLECLKELIVKGGEVNYKNSNGWTPLHFAAYNGQLQCLLELIDKGGKVNCKDSNGWSCLHFAAFNGHLQYVQEYITKGDEVNSKDSYSATFLHAAAKAGHLHFLQELIAKGGKVNSQNLDGQTPLHSAAYEGKLQCLQKLIDKGGQVNIKDIKGRTPLHYASYNGHFQCLQELIAESSEVNSKDSDNRTPLHIAVYSGHLQCVQELIAKGGEVNSKDYEGRTPLHFAAYEGYLQCLQELIAKSAKIDSKDNKGATSLHVAAYRGHLQCLQELITKGSDVNFKDSNGQTPLYFAAIAGNLQCLQELIAKGADTHSIDLTGASPLDITEDFLCKLALIDFESL